MTDDSAGLPPGLLQPAAYPHPVESVEMIETHISWVLLTGEYVYKLKKPVDLGFVDFTTLTLRKHFCEEEVRLNRRLAPDLYTGVVPICGSRKAPTVGGDGPVFDYAVKMRQFDRSQSLDHLLDQNRADPEELADIARRLGRFHLGLPACSDSQPYGGPDIVAAAVRQNFAQIEPFLSADHERRCLGSLNAWSEERLETLWDRLAERKACGWVRECHGDLHSGNITRLGDRLIAFDCLEFNPEFRWLDVISEVSFLGMDLAARGREDLAYALFNDYLETTLDYDAATLIDFYRVYFCLVRAKVSAMTRDQHSAPTSAVHWSLHPGLADYLALAGRLVSKPPPRLLFTHGLSGSGKTWVSQRLLKSLPAIRIRADVIRKHLHGLASDEESGSEVGGGLYTEAATRRTYDELGSLAARLLNGGVTVLIDAACLKRWQRERFAEVAEKAGVAWRIVDCDAALDVLRSRIRKRQRAGRDASEAGLAVLDHQLRTREPLGEAERSHILEIGTAEGHRGRQ